MLKKFEDFFPPLKNKSHPVFVKKTLAILLERVKDCGLLNKTYPLAKYITIKSGSSDFIYDTHSIDTVVKSLGRMGYDASMCNYKIVTDDETSMTKPYYRYRWRLMKKIIKRPRVINVL